MHRQIMQAPKGTDVDHVNHDTLKNVRSNLRVCTRSQHHANRKKGLGFTSRFKGVGWASKSSKWQARIKKDGKEANLGYFDDERDAARAYNRAAREHFGEFALLNDV